MSPQLQDHILRARRRGMRVERNSDIWFIRTRAGLPHYCHTDDELFCYLGNYLG